LGFDVNDTLKTSQTMQDETSRRPVMMKTSSLPYIAGVTAGFAVYEILQEIFFPSHGSSLPPEDVPRFLEKHM
jgi:hypothetical protein